MADREAIVAHAVTVLDRARREGVQMPDIPAELRIPDFAAADEIQARLIRDHGPIGGWKVSAGGEGRPPLIASPIPEAILRQSGESFTLSGRRNVYIEAEIAFALGPGIDGWDGSSDTIGTCIEDCRVAMEVLCSRFETDLAELPGEHLTADLGGCAALFSGAAIPLDRLRRPETGSAVLVAPDGTRHERQEYAHDPLGLLQALATDAKARGRPLQSGEIVTTGAIAFASAMPGRWTATVGGASLEAILE